jgi:uncharacterized membrane protein YphA (DoxX/SURF4 family)
VINDLLTPLRAQYRDYEFNLALAGMTLTLLIAGAGAYSLDSVLGVLW